MKKSEYAAFEALDPFFEIILRGLSSLVDGEYYFYIFNNDSIFESRYYFPGWPTMIRGRVDGCCSVPWRDLQGAPPVKHLTSLTGNRSSDPQELSEDRSDCGDGPQFSRG